MWVVELYELAAAPAPKLTDRWATALPSAPAAAPPFFAAKLKVWPDRVSVPLASESIVSVPAAWLAVLVRVTAPVAFAAAVEAVMPVMFKLAFVAAEVTSTFTPTEPVAPRFA